MFDLNGGAEAPTCNQTEYTVHRAQCGIPQSATEGGGSKPVTSILPQNTSPDAGSGDTCHPAETFLQLIGKDPAQTWFRTFGTGGKANRTRSGRDLHGFDAAALEADNRAGEAVFLITGDADQATGRAIADADITRCTSVFVEWDDRPIEWQVQAWQELGLPEPTAMVTTGGKSVHCYWQLLEPMAPDQWRALQRRLIEHAGGDKACKNPSRLMRLPGFRYIDKATGKVTDNVAELIHSAGTCYTAEELEACLPPPQAPTPSPAPRLQPQATELPQRSEDDLLKALERVPEFRHDEGRRDELLGLAMRLTVEWGAEKAHAWLAQHSPTIKDLAGYFNTAPTQISPGSIWPFLNEHYGVSLKRNDLKRPEPVAAPATTQAAPERPPASLQALIQRLPDGWSDHGKPRTLSPGALAEMLPALRFRFNDLDLRAQVETSSGWQRITDADLDSAYVLLTGKGWKIGADPVVKAILHVARQNTIHPVQDYLQRVKADPTITPYDLDQVAPNLFRASQPLHVAMVRKWLIGAVARALNPGCQMDYCLVLQGAQGLLKSTSLKALASGDWFSSSHADQEKDFLLNVHSCWIYELAELESITGRKAAGALKNLITTATDSFRPPYGRTLERHHRQSVFCATVNKDQFLRDDTGNRRFWVVPIEGTEQLDRDAISAARDAIWKAAVLAHEAGELPMLSTELEALSAEQNEQFNEQDPWIGMVRAWMDGDPLHRWDPERDPSVARFDPAGAFTSAEILYSAGLKRTDAISRNDEMRVGEVLRALGFKRDKNPVTTAGGRVRLWRPTPCTTCTTCTTSDFEVVHPENPFAATDLTSPAQPAQPKSPTGRLKSEGGSETPLPANTTPAHSHEEKKVVQVVQPAQTDCGASDLSCTTSGFEVVQVVQEVVHPPLTRSTPPIGSGADVIDDGDDPHWPKRPEVA